MTQMMNESGHDRVTRSVASPVGRKRFDEARREMNAIATFAAGGPLESSFAGLSRPARTFVQGQSRARREAKRWLAAFADTIQRVDDLEYEYANGRPVSDVEWSVIADVLDQNIDAFRERLNHLAEPN